MNTLLLTLTTSFAVLANPSPMDWVGQVMPPYPEGLEDIGGSCVDDRNGYRNLCNFSIGVLAESGADSEGGLAPRYAIAGKEIGRDGSRALWQITDVAEIPGVEPGFGWQSATCRINGEDDARVIAVVRYEDAEYLKDVAWARKLDLDSGRFVVPDLAAVDCLNEGYGEELD